MVDSYLKDKSFDFFGQAQNYIKPKSRVEKTKAAQQLVTTIANEMSKPIVIPDVSVESEESEIQIPDFLRK